MAVSVELADARIAADEHQGAGHQPSAQDAVQLSDAGHQAGLADRAHVRERHGTRRGAARAGLPPGPDERLADGARSRRGCSRPRSRGTAPATALLDGRTGRRRGRWRSGARGCRPTGRIRRHARRAPPVAIARAAGRDQRVASSAATTSASRSSVCSHPALKRMKPSGTSSVPQRAAPLGGGVHAAEAGGLVDEPAGGEEGLGALRAPDVEPQHGPEAAHLANGDGVGGIAGKARVADGDHVLARGQELGERPALAVPRPKAQRERGQRAVGEPRLEGPGDGRPTALARRAARPPGRGRGW